MILLQKLKFTITFATEKSCADLIYLSVLNLRALPLEGTIFHILVDILRPCGTLFTPF